MWWLIGATSVAALVFVTLNLKASRNMLFYIQWMRIYWIVKDNGTLSTPRCMRAFMRQTSPPWWRGKGIQLRIGKNTIQVGVLREKAIPVSVTDMEDDAGGLLAQLGGRELNVDVKTIRKEWV